MFKRAVFTAALMVASLVAPSAGFTQSAVEQNSNVVGRTAPGYYRGIPAMQDNEGSCAINPILPRNIVCAWNASGGSDDAIGDTWLRFSESLDGGRTFFNRYLNGSKKDVGNNIGQQFAADPVMMCWPGGCGTVMLASTRGESGGEGGGIYMQWMADLNTESGFRKAFKINLDQVYRSTGSKFADKPHALYMLDETNPGTVNVAFDVELPDGQGGFRTERVERSWPKARILVVFALFNPSKNDIEILSTYTDDYGTNWSNPRQIAQTSGRDQGVSLAAIGDTVFFGFRRFASGDETDDIMGVVSNDRGDRMSKPFVVVPDVCVYDVPTLPSATNRTAAAARTNDFPWVSEDGSNFVMVYSERRFGEEGCLGDPNKSSDSRIMATVSSNGRNWSTDPTEVAPNPDHGFQFMPVVDCSLGICQVAWWDSRRDSARVRDFLLAKEQPAILDVFENIPILADFHLPFDPTPDANGNVDNTGYQFRRTADIFTKKITLQSGGINNSDQATQASRYRLTYNPVTQVLTEREFNPFNVKAYKTNTVPFMSDYNSMTSVKHRFVFDPTNLSQPPFWESNAGPNPLNESDEPMFWLAWTDARNMRGAIYTYDIDGTPPYARRVAAPPTTGADDSANEADGEATLAAEAVEDFNPTPDVCTSVDPVKPNPNIPFVALHNRIKDSDIYGALIENKTTAWSLNPSKTLGLIQRTYVVVAENESTDPLGKIFRFVIENQPVGYEDSPRTARASWKQLPYDLLDPAFQDAVEEPREGEETDTVAFEAVGPQSSASVALFVVSDESVNPVVVSIYDTSTTPETLVNSVIINGAVEAGPLLNANGVENNNELHNPWVFAPNSFNLDHYDELNPDQFNPDQYNPDQFNPDLFNPDQFNPDQFNPDQFNPDQFNPDQFNPDQFNPDQFNPDQFNPDQFNPDQFNPDQFNPDQFNPDQFNVALTDSDDLHNPEIPKPIINDSWRDGDGNAIVSKVDVNFGIRNIGNTLTPYVVDLALADPQILEWIASGEISTQIIAWQEKQIDDEQFCNPRLITENRVIAAVNNPDLTKLTIPDILNNRVGALTYFVAPGDILQNTIRFIGPTDTIKQVEAKLRDDIISYVFTSQAANTGEDTLLDEREQIINDRTPATFNFQSGVQTLEANVPGGAYLPSDYITATKDDKPVGDFSCTPALPTTIPLNDPIDDLGTALSCTATTDNGVTASLELTIDVYDTEAPIIDPLTVPTNIVTEADSPAGSIVTYTTPEAEDVFGVDPDVTVACSPASGTLFPFQAPDGPETTVICTAVDASGNESDPLGPPPTTFTVTLEDTAAPVIDPNVGYDPLPPPITLGANQSSYILNWDFAVTDADTSLTVTCDPGDPVMGPMPPLYEFNHDFSVGVTQVTCTATDSSGQTTPTPLSFSVEIIDITPPVITLNGESTVTVEQGSGPYVDEGATAVDNNDPNVLVTFSDNSSTVDTDTAGTYTVTITATDPSGNASTVTRTVIVELKYGMTGVIPRKTSVEMGSSNPLEWAWLDSNGNPVDTSGILQQLRIEDCDDGTVIINPVGDPGASGFRFKADNWWQFNWNSEAPSGRSYCAYVYIEPTDQEMGWTRQIRVR